jgi:hypothetical protein
VLIGRAKARGEPLKPAEYGLVAFLGILGCRFILFRKHCTSKEIPFIFPPCRNLLPEKPIYIDLF